MDAQTLNLIISAVSGPASGVAVAMLCILMFGYFLVKHLLPQQQKMIDDFVKESRASRKVFVDAVEIMSRRLDKVEDTVSDIKDILKERS
jgi:RNase adaptor protein for sRNA GlmZ degradation